LRNRGAVIKKVMAHHEGPELYEITEEIDGKKSRSSEEEEEISVKKRRKGRKEMVQIEVNGESWSRLTRNNESKYFSIT
jgi:hypothetical protein